MNQRMTQRLFIYFSAALIIFSIVIGSLFSLLFLKHIRNEQLKEFRQQAINIAEMIEYNSRIMQENHSGHHMRCHSNMRQNMTSHHMYCRRIISDNSNSIGQYLKSLNILSQSEIWIVDSETKSYILYGAENSTSYEELPINADEMLERVFAGEVAISEDFSTILTAPSITIGVPLKSSNHISKALLLHKNLADLQELQRESLKTFAVCIAVGFIAALIMSIILSRRFVRPLKNMEEMAAQLATGNYRARSGILQDDEIGSLASSLDILAKKLDEATSQKAKLDKMRQDFIADISHELRTPITVLRGSVELLMSELVTDKIKRQNYLRQMSDNIISLQRLVNDLFELSRLQNADFDIEKSELNLSDALNAAIHSAEQIAASKAIKIICRNLPVIIAQGDYDRLKQMFLIVLDNAVKFSPEDSTIEVTAENVDELCRIEIRDHGCGIDESELPNIFERFKSHKGFENPGGTGLGLPIAAAIAKRHDIEISCQNMFDGGACFTFLVHNAQLMRKA